MSQVERILYDVFTYYTIQGNPLEIFTINNMNFTHLMRDCNLIYDDKNKRKKRVYKFEGTLTETDVYIMFCNRSRLCAEKRRINENVHTGNMCPLPYEEFLTLVTEVAARLYPSNTQVDAMRHLLLEHILVKAKRRDHVSIDKVLKSDAIQKLYERFKLPFEFLYNFYGFQTSEREGKTDNRNKLQLIQTKSSDPKLAYREFVKFAKDMGCGSNITISMTQIASVFVSSIIPKDNNVLSIGDSVKLSFDQLWECLVRIALLTYSASTAHEEDKVKSLLLAVWHTLQESSNRNLGSFGAQAVGTNSSKAKFIRGSQILNERFLKMWAEDGHRTYLAPPDVVKSEGSTIIAQITRKEKQSSSNTSLPVPTESSVIGGLKDSTSTNKMVISPVYNVKVEGNPDEIISVAHPRLTVSKLNDLLEAKPDLRVKLIEVLSVMGA